TPDENVTVSASVTDDVSGLKSVTLLYSIDGGATWSSVTMTKIIILDNGIEKYKAEIPEQASGTTVQFKVSAEDNVFFSAESTVASYTVKTFIFGMEPLLFYGLIIGLVVVIIIVVVVVVLVRRPKPRAAPPPAPPVPPAAPPAVPAAAYCTKCGAPIKPGDVYCPKCGQKLG
ncbi:MAG: zinc ribbon domain-containing protein, partial [Candidatus Bathyarchaeota archaeon]|nr:zinc ribbon domain-containing protein [Candidatus Bathyarchaeota archaeon]